MGSSAHLVMVALEVVSPLLVVAIGTEKTPKVVSVPESQAAQPIRS